MQEKELRGQKDFLLPQLNGCGGGVDMFMFKKGVIEEVEVCKTHQDAVLRSSTKQYSTLVSTLTGTLTSTLTSTI